MFKVWNRLAKRSPTWTSSINCDFTLILLQKLRYHAHLMIPSNNTGTSFGVAGSLIKLIGGVNKPFGMYNEARVKRWTFVKIKTLNSVCISQSF